MIDLDERIASFLDVKVPHVPFRRRGYVIRELADPAVAADRCSSASHAFYVHLRAALPTVAFPPDFGITMLYVGWVGEVVRHTVVLVEATVVDWTARQFDPTAAFPLVEDVEAYLSRCDGTVEDFFGAEGPWGVANPATLVVEGMTE